MSGKIVVVGEKKFLGGLRNKKMMWRLRRAVVCVMYGRLECLLPTSFLAVVAVRTFRVG